jgi:hypothetical protein
MTEYKIGDLVVIKSCKESENIGKVGRVIGFQRAGEVSEEFETSDKDGVIVRALYGKFSVEYGDGTVEDTVDLCFDASGECLETIYKGE